MKIRNVVTLAAALTVGGSIALAQGGKAPEKPKAAATATDTGKKVTTVEKTAAKGGKKGAKAAAKAAKMDKLDTTKKAPAMAPAKKPTN